MDSYPVNFGFRDISVAFYIYRSMEIRTFLNHCYLPTIEMDLRKASLSAFGSTILRNAVSFVAIAFFSNNLGVAALGSFFLFQTLLLVISIPVDFGIRTGIEKRVSEGKHPGRTLATGLSVKTVLLFIFLIGIFLFRGYINQYIGAEVTPLLGIALILNEVGQIGRHTLRGEHRVSLSSVFQPLRTLIWAIGGGILSLIGFSQMALFWSYVAGLGTLSLLGVLLIDTKLGRPSLSEAKALIGYSKFAVIGSIGGMIYNWTDVLLIGVFLSQTAVGAYEIAWRVATVSLVLTNAVRISMFPQANTWGADGEIDKIEALVERAYVPGFYLVIPLAIGGSIVGGDLLSIFFNVEHLYIQIVLIILLIEKLQRAIVLPLIAPMHAIGNVKYAAYTTLLGAGTNVIANLILIPGFGIVGAALGTTIGATVNTASHTWILSKDFDIRVPIGEMAWLVISGLIMAAGVFVAKLYLDPLSFVDLFSIILGGGILYGLTSIKLDTIREELLSAITTFI